MVYWSGNAPWYVHYILLEYYLQCHKMNFQTNTVNPSSPIHLTTYVPKIQECVFGSF